MGCGSVGFGGVGSCELGDFVGAFVGGVWVVAQEHVLGQFFVKEVEGYAVRLAEFAGFFWKFEGSRLFWVFFVGFWGFFGDFYGLGFATALEVAYVVTHLQEGQVQKVLDRERLPLFLFHFLLFTDDVWSINPYTIFEVFWTKKPFCSLSRKMIFRTRG